MALHTALYSIALMANKAEWAMKDGTLTLDNTCGASCTHTVTGTSTGGKIVVNGGTHNITLDDVTIDVSATVSACAFEITGGATVNLTLSGTNTLKSGHFRAGLEVNAGNTLTITSGSTGSLTATSSYYGAGIGGSDGSAGGSITISGGTVAAQGGYGGAGIGGGYNGAGGSTTISGGTVTATGDGDGNGIGGGYNGAGGSITISNGAVTANGSGVGAGIGGAGVSITISGGTVTSQGGYGGAGISIIIRGGAVTANGSGGGAGIGGSYGGNGGSVTVSGGTVIANGSNSNSIYGSAGIGGGVSGAGGNITIEGNAVVFATKGTGASHIGAGSNGTGGTVTKNGGIIFEGDIGTVYGTSVTPTADFIIPLQYMLTIESDQTVDISDVRATNNGTIVNRGIINGTFIGNLPLAPGDTVPLDISGLGNYVNITATGYRVGTAPNEISHTGKYIITGTATDTSAQNHITVSGGTHDIIFQNVSIQLTATGKSSSER